MGVFEAFPTRFPVLTSIYLRYRNPIQSFLMVSYTLVRIIAVLLINNSCERIPPCLYLFRRFFMRYCICYSYLSTILIHIFHRIARTVVALPEAIWYFSQGPIKNKKHIYFVTLQVKKFLRHYQLLLKTGWNRMVEMAVIWSASPF